MINLAKLHSGNKMWTFQTQQDASVSGPSSVVVEILHIVSHGLGCAILTQIAAMAAMSQWSFAEMLGSVEEIIQTRVAS